VHPAAETLEDTIGMKARILAGAALATAVALLPAAADAKGVTQVTVSGPDLARSITLSTENANYLAQATGLYSAFFNTVPPATLEPSPPSDTLGPRYVATYTYSIPEQRTERQATLRQELYPLAVGGPVAYTPPGQKLFDATSRAGWHHDPRLAPLLIAAGIPAPAPPQPVSTPVDATPRLTG
jgi:hypothetical protein